MNRRGPAPARLSRIHIELFLSGPLWGPDLECDHPRARLRMLNDDTATVGGAISELNLESITGGG